MTPLRVAFFTDSFHEVNGVALTSREFVAHARRRQLPLFSVHAGPRTCASQDGSVTTWEFKRGRVRWNLERDLAIDILFLRYRRQLMRLLQGFKPDLIHITGPGDAGILGALASYELKVPFVASWHTNLHEFAERRIERALARWPERTRSTVARWMLGWSLDRCMQFYGFARATFAPNPELVGLLETRTHRPCHLMQRGIDAALFSPSRRARTDSKFTIGYVGRLSPEKNVRLFVPLERALIAAGLSDFQFLIVGDGSERLYLAGTLDRARLPGVFRGEALAEAYSSMDALVFPSETDTFGNVVLEAMASGVVPIVSGAGGPRYLVEDGKTGYVARDLDQYVRALVELESKPMERRLMAQAARASAQWYSWNAVFDRVHEQYRSVLRSVNHANANERPFEPVGVAY